MTVFHDPVPPVDIILDTNVVLDWLVFQHPPGGLIGQQVMDGRLRWIITEAMHDELIDVLGRLLTLPSLLRWQAQHTPAMEAVSRHAQHVAGPPPLPITKRLRCTDPDDQIFIDLAMARSTRWLVSRDRALLRLAKRARPHGVEVLTPERWLHWQNLPQPEQAP